MATKTRKTVYDPATKAAALAALLEGQGTSKVAAEFKLPEGTVKAWRSRLHEGASPIRSVATQKKDAIGALLLDYLQTNLETLKIQSVFFRDTKWLALQSAADAAVLHGVMTDKAIRLLEALGGSSDTAPPPAR